MSRKQITGIKIAEIKTSVEKMSDQELVEHLTSPDHPLKKLYNKVVGRHADLRRHFTNEVLRRKKPF